MNDESQRLPLAAHLRRAGHELACEQPPRALPDAILRSLRPRPAPRRAAAWRRAAWPALGAACAALLAAVVWGDASAPADAGGGFVAVAGREHWLQAAQRDGSAWLVAAEMPQARLATLGLPYDTGRAGETVHAQLLIHSSGDVLAVRVIR